MLISIDGILPNALLAIVHFIQILLIPIFSPIIFYLALCEMTTLSGYDNNGKFKVKYSLLKKFFTYSLYLSLIFFALLYFSMLCFVLVWAILASIFNPSVYLPYSAAALTLIGTVTSKYQQIEARFRNLTKELERIIMEKIGLNL